MPTHHQGLLSPLRHVSFRSLWLVWLSANICMWMNDVAAAWVMTFLTDSATLIALVQTASSLPVLLLGVPSGSLADILNKKSFFIFTQMWLTVNALLLFFLALFNLLNPYLTSVLIVVFHLQN
jgi:MFS family permease